MAKQKKAPDDDKAAPSDRKKVTLYLPTPQWRALKVYAAKHDQDMSVVVSELLKKAGIESE